MNFHPQPAAQERIALLIEECAEVTQAATKILRHGFESVDPTAPPHKQRSNRKDLEHEVGHLRYAIDLLCRELDLDSFAIIESRERKAQTIGQWLHYNRGGK